MQSRLDIAKRVGATHVIDTSKFQDLAGDLTQAIMEIVPAGTNCNIDTTGVHGILLAGIQSLHPRGELLLIGVVMGQLPVDVADILSVRSNFQYKVQASFLRTNWLVVER